MWWHHDTGTWFPSFSSTPQGMPTEGLGLDPSSSTLSPVPQPTAAVPAETSETPKAPAVVPLGTPLSLKVYRGPQVIIPMVDVGQYKVVDKVDPPGNGPVWLTNVGSTVGTGMGTAWIAGHTELLNSAMPFNQLGAVQSGDLIDIVVGDQTVTFQVDAVGPPPVLPDHPGTIEITNDPNMVKLVSCTPDGGANIVVTAHAVSL